MDQNNTSQLFEQLKNVMLEGDEQKTKDFIMAHLKEFPEQFQQEVAASLLNEALERSIKTNAEEYDKKAEGLADILKKIETTLQNEETTTEETAVNESAEEEKSESTPSADNSTL